LRIENGELGIWNLEFGEGDLELGNAVRDKSFEFAVRVVALCGFLSDEKREYVLSRQLLRSGTSIGANIREALQGQSKKDFLSKINIALKEANESLYWIELLGASGILTEPQKGSMWKDCNELISLLTAIVKTTKKSLKTTENKTTPNSKNPRTAENEQTR
jgi:four helix bundle protein